MKLQSLYLPLLIAAMLSGCVSGNVTIKPTPTVKEPSLPTSMLLTPTLISSPVPTATLHPVATLEPQQTGETIQTWLQKPDCLAPCFLGIIPRKTTFSEAKKIFTWLGIEPTHTNTRDNKEFYQISYDFNNGLSINAILAIQSDVVINLKMNINPEKQKVGVPRRWLAYSPETLIKQYGTPSKVAFEVGRGPSVVDYGMVMYFDSVDLIIEYGGYDVALENKSFRICPVTDQSDGVRVWLGQNPEHPPVYGVSLEDATSLTLEEFSKLITESPDKACVSLKEEMFP